MQKGIEVPLWRSRYFVGQSQGRSPFIVLAKFNFLIPETWYKYFSAIVRPILKGVRKLKGNNFATFFFLLTPFLCKWR